MSPPETSTPSWTEALRALDREPGSAWRERVVHHGFRALAVAAVAVAVPLLFPRSPLPNFALLEEGMVAPQEVIAEIPFAVRKDPEELEAERREAVSGVLPVYAYRPAVVDSTLADVGAFFAGLDTLARGGSADTAGIRAWMEARGVQPAPAQARYLLDAGNREELRGELDAAFREILPQGVAPASDLAEATDRLVLRGPEDERVVAADSLLALGSFYRRAAERPVADSTAAALQLYHTLLVHFVVPTVRLDRDATEAARRRAREAVEETETFVLEGERIVAAHERVGAAEMEKLRAYRQALLDRSGGGTAVWSERLGSAVHALVVLGLLTAVLLLYRPEVYRSVDSYLIVLLTVLVVMLAASWIARSGAPTSLIPAAFSAIVVAALFDGFLGVAAALALALLLAGQPAFAGVTVPFLAATGGAAAALAVPWIRRRAQSWMIIAAITGGYVLAGAALTLLRYFSPSDLLATAGWGGINATLCAVFAVGAVVPALEKLTGITTDQTLLEYSDLNRPLLKRLSREAPGTYAHSINVANLAEAACAAIGANALLARVGTYYHDIGKMVRPQYFVENQPRGRNPHDRLRPSRSAAVIREHVREGLRLAEEEAIPEVIRDFIPEHHGTQRIAYFLQKAREEEPDLEIDPSDFAYPGPKPRSKETAVVMLADAVESTTRALQNPSTERIREVVDRIVQARIDNGQLDRSPLTLQDIDRIKATFARVLTGMYHHRIDYPREAAGGAPVEERAAARGPASSP